MTVLQTRFEHLLNELRQRKYRLTPQRMELLRLILISEDHPSAAQLYEQIKGKFPTMSLATVYKTLDLLKELGEVVEINLHADNHFDAYRPNPHLHLICTSCKKILDGGSGTTYTCFGGRSGAYFRVSNTTSTNRLLRVVPRLSKKYALGFGFINSKYTCKY